MIWLPGVKAEKGIAPDLLGLFDALEQKARALPAQLEIDRDRRFQVGGQLAVDGHQRALGRQVFEMLAVSYAIPLDVLLVQQKRRLSSLIGTRGVLRFPWCHPWLGWLVKQKNAPRRRAVQTSPTLCRYAPLPVHSDDA